MIKSKIQKVLAQMGLASRRQIESWITAGKIRINGQLAQLGDRVALTDQVQVEGRTIKLHPPSSTRVILYHKPPGELCTRRDTQGRKTIFERLPAIEKGRWIQVGRLDYQTSGLLLLTNNGELAHRLMHPRQAIEREYLVRVLGALDKAAISRLLKGVMLEDGLARFHKIVPVRSQGANQWFRVITKEGRNRLVRRLIATQHQTVSRLIRVCYGPIQLPSSLKSGEVIELGDQHIRSLCDVATVH